MASRPIDSITGSPSFPHTWRVPEKYVPVTEQILVGDGEAAWRRVGRRSRQRAVAAPRRAGEPNARGKCRTAPGRARSDQCALDHARYFTTVGVPVVNGRSFVASDRKATMPVAIVNAWAAQRWWPDRDAIGRTVRVDTGGGTVVITVVGVVANSKAARPNILLAEDGPELYLPYEQAPSAFPVFFAAAARPEPLSKQMSQLLTRLVPDRPVFTSLVSQTVERQLGGVRTNAMQILAFALVGLLLAVIGVYGVLSFDVSRRTREIGIRSALGASRARIAGNTIADAAKLMMIGIAIGIPIALYATRLISGLLYTTSPRDPAVYGSVILCIAVLSLVAAYVPARRAVRVDPIVALKSAD